MKIHSTIIVSSKDLYRAFSSEQSTVSMSARLAASVMRFSFETKTDVIALIAESFSPSGVDIKDDSSLTDMLLLILASGVVPIDVADFECTNEQKFYTNIKKSKKNSW